MNEIEAIFCKLLNCDRASLYMDKHASFLSDRQARDLESILKKRISGEPLQYILGDTEFMGLCFKVAPGVLIPRPETERLVEEALRTIGTCPENPYRVLDIGTGSGNIAVSLAKLARAGGVVIDAVDVSAICLDVAAANARLHHVSDKIHFYRSDIFSGCSSQAVYNMIISNPPYVTEKEYDALPPDVRREPLGALVAPHNGLYFYEKIESGARRYLAPGGKVFVEIGDRQAGAVGKIFSDEHFWSGCCVLKDYNDRDRVFEATRAAGIVHG